MTTQGRQDREEPSNFDEKFWDPRENPSLIEELETAVEVSDLKSITLVITTRSETGVKNEAALAFQFFDSSGTPLANEQWPTVSKSIGEYQYLETSPIDMPHTQAITLNVPEGAHDLYVRGYQWAEGTSTLVIGPLETVTIDPAREFTLTETPAGRPLPNKSSDFRSRHMLSGSPDAVLVSLNVYPGEQLGSSPLQIQFLDDYGSEIPGLGDLPQHPQFGSFISLTPQKDAWTTIDAEVKVPEGASELRLNGVDWGKKSANILGPIRVSNLKAKESTLREFIRNCKNSEALLVIDTTAPPLGHETLSLRPNNLSDAYAELGCSVVFFPFSTLQEQQSLVGPNKIQFDRSDFDFVVDKLNSAELDIPKIYICSSFPSLQACTKAERLKAAGWRIIYECRDDMEEFNRVGYSKWYHPQLERHMLDLAESIVSVSKSLDEKLASLVTSLDDHHVVPNGVNESVIKRGQVLRTQSVVQKRNLSKTFGYVGHLTASWFDWPLVLAAASELPETRFEIVGHGMPNGITMPDNVQYLGPKTHDELIEIVDGWRAGLIPFADVPLTRSVDPNKIYEYAAWGLRCVSAPMGMVETYPSTWVYRGKNQFIECLKENLETPITFEEVQTLEEFVLSCTWRERAKQMRQTLHF